MKDKKCTLKSGDFWIKCKNYKNCNNQRDKGMCKWYTHELGCSFKNFFLEKELFEI